MLNPQGILSEVQFRFNQTPFVLTFYLCLVVVLCHICSDSSTSSNICAAHKKQCLFR